MKAAFFKGRSSGIMGLFDIADHAWMEGEFSHVELLFSDGRSASSVAGSGVRFTAPGSIDFTDPTQWELVDCSSLDEQAAIDCFNKNLGNGYDYRGDAHFVIGFIQHDSKDDLCSEICAYATGFEQAWRFDPNSFYVALKRVVATTNCK
jgi:uncharacterized protein YycO